MAGSPIPFVYQVLSSNIDPSAPSSYSCVYDDQDHIFTVVFPQRLFGNTALTPQGWTVSVDDVEYEPDSVDMYAGGEIIVTLTGQNRATVGTIAYDGSNESVKFESGIQVPAFESPVILVE